MAKASSKKIASQNASTLQILLYGFISSNIIHLLFTFILWKSSLNTAKVLLYLITESIAISLAWVLKGMASKGDDLSQSGLTAYMFDIIYVTWFVHILTGLLSTYFWWLYSVIPLYAISLLYSKLILPYVFKNQSPFDSLKRIISGSAKNGEDPLNFNGNAGGGTEGMSKRQAKLQKRMEKGDGRVQKRTTTR